MRKALVHNITIPIPDTVIRNLRIGDSVLLNGILVTARDTAHQWLMDNFITPSKPPSESDQEAYHALKQILNHGLIYHCGPVVGGLDTRQYQFIAAGPTTSIREEPFQAEVMHHFNLKGIIGKGGMGVKTLEACQEVPAVYFHAIGGAATIIAEKVKRVKAVYKLEFGVPEALWVIEVKDFPVIVTMDAHGSSLHADVKQKSEKILQRLIS
jgi:fumarate hydratase subunit beta